MILKSQLAALIIAHSLLASPGMANDRLPPSPVTSAGASSSASQYGPVRAKENLWDIAERFSTAGITVSQTAINIFEHNPDAFYENNINRLKQGVVLTIPVAQGKQVVASREAVQVLQQHDSSYQAFYRDFTMKPAQLRQKKPPFAAVAALALPVTSEKDPESPSLAEQQVLPEIDVQEQHPETAAASMQLAAVSSQNTQAQQEHKDHHDEIAVRFSYDVSASYDDNVRRAQWESDIRDDYLVNMIVKGKMRMGVSQFSNLTLGGRLGIEKYSTFEKLDNALYQLDLKYSFAFSSGFAAPVYALKISAGGMDSESEIRTSDIASIGLEMNNWLSDTIIFTGGIKHKQREARSRVFDTEETQVFANFDVELSVRRIVYLTYSYVTGDIVSSATPRLGIINAAEVIEPDDAFGGQAFNQFAYRLDADSNVFTVGYNSAIKRGLTWDLSVRYIDSEAQDSDQIYYERLIVRAGLLGRF